MSEIDEIEEKPATTPVKKKSSAKKVKISEFTLIKVKSCFCGKMIYRNPISKLKIIWNEQGDVQTMSIAELRTMIGTQIGFFERQLVELIGTIDEDEEITVEDIYKTLAIEKYYRALNDMSNPVNALSWTEKEIETNVAKLSASAKENLIATLRSNVDSGKLDSIKKIKAFEKALDCDLI